MHIICTENEFNKYIRSNSNFPPETTAVLLNEVSERAVYRYIYRKGDWHLHADFVENDRPWNSEEEEERFIETINDRKSIALLFAKQDEFEDTIPSREYTTADQWFYHLFTYIMPPSSYLTEYDDPQYNQQYNVFLVAVPKNATKNILREVEDEIKDVMQVQTALHPNVNSFYFEVVSDMLEIPSLEIERNGKCKLGDSEFTSLSSVLRYMTIYAYYE